MRRRSRASLLGLLAMVASCTDLLGPPLPPGAILLDPLPAEFAGWYSLTERCSQRQGDLADLAWYVVPSVAALPGEDGAVGLYQGAGHRIVLAEPYVRDGFTVRHEMLHALGAGGHPRALFLEQCGGVVGCGEPCQAEAGTEPVWNTLLPLAADHELVVDVQLIPGRVGPNSEPCPSIAVSVTNVSGQPRSVDARRGAAFRYSIDGWGSGGGGVELADPRIALDDDQAWTWVSDCPRVLEQGLASGEYLVRGMFNSLLSDPVILTVER